MTQTQRAGRREWIGLAVLSLACPYTGNQHDDPRSTSDCTTGNPAVAQAVRIAEFQAFPF